MASTSLPRFDHSTIGKVSRVHTFSAGGIDRLHNSRSNPLFVEAQCNRPDALFVPFSKLRPLLRPITSTDGPSNEIGWCTREQLSAVSENLFPLLNYDQLASQGEGLSSEWVLLGQSAAHVPLIAIDVSQYREGQEKLTGKFSDLRFLSVTVTPSEASTLAMARSLLAWATNTKYCASCGSRVFARDGGVKRRCVNEACTVKDFYPRVADPSMIVVISNPSKTKCLLGRGAQFPPGMYSCLAGFVEAGESLEECVVREVKEESGVSIDLASVQYHSSQPWPFPGSMMCGFTATALSEEMAVDEDELQDAKWFTFDEIQGMISRCYEFTSAEPRVPPPWAIAHHLISHWAAEHARPLSPAKL